MSLNTFKTTLRFLWKNRLFTVLNILGLSIGISACWIIYSIVSFHFSFDKDIPEKSSVYRVVSHFRNDNQESGNAGVPVPLVNAISSQVPGVKTVIPVWEGWQRARKVTVTGTDGRLTTYDNPEGLVSVNNTFFGLMPFKWLAGSEKDALNAPDKVVLTRSRAQKYFPGIKPEQLLGQTLIYNDTLPVKVSGVVEDAAGPRSINCSEIFALNGKRLVSDKWGSVSSGDGLYLKLDANTAPAKVLAAINTISEKNGAIAMRESHYKRWHELIPLSDLHFATDYSDNIGTRANKMVLYGLVAIAIFLLLLACINYVNLTTAQVPQRAKEIGIRKTLGSSRKNLIRRFMGETAVIVLLSLGVSLFLSGLLMRIFKHLMPEGMELYHNYTGLVLFLALLTLLITFLSGSYPAWLITRIQPVNIMKRSTGGYSGNRSLLLRKNLIVFQFVISQFFIVGAVIVSKQLHYMLNGDFGFNKEAMVLASVPWKVLADPRYKDRQFLMTEELKQLPGVQSAALGEPPMSNSYSSGMFSYIEKGGKEHEVELYRKSMDTGMLRLYHFTLLAGRNTGVSDTTNELLINETAAKAFGFRTPEAAVGAQVTSYGSSMQITGVVKDYHSADYSKKIQATALFNGKNSLYTANIKLQPGHPDQWQQVLKKAEGVWKKYYPDAAFDYHFYDEQIGKMYEAEQDMSQIVNLATLICIIISCLGLLGLSTLTAFQRVKEIGIRKVLGASVLSIVQLLSGDMLKLVALAVLIASPIAWWASHKWLQNYVYRIDIQPWIFVVAGITALAIALLTMSFQAIKAALVKPVKSLRSE